MLGPRQSVLARHVLRVSLRPAGGADVEARISPLHPQRAADGEATQVEFRHYTGARVFLNNATVALEFLDQLHDVIIVSVFHNANFIWTIINTVVF